MVAQLLLIFIKAKAVSAGGKSFDLVEGENALAEVDRPFLHPQFFVLNQIDYNFSLGKEGVEGHNEAEGAERENQDALPLEETQQKQNSE